MLLFKITQYIRLCGLIPCFFFYNVTVNSREYYINKSVLDE